MEKIDINKFVINHIQQIKPFDPAEPLDSMAEKAGVHGILVLSGEATMEDLESAPQSPSLVVGSVDELSH